MKMKRCIVPSILLMLSLEAALLVAAGRPSTATGADDVGTILLPSEGKGKAGMVATRPWKCCDRAFCTKSIPQICKCADEVDQCASTCQACVPSMLNPSRHVCEDIHTGDPGPECSEDGGLNDGVAKAEGASQDPQVIVAAAKKGEEEERPWKCCDLALCTRSFPPMCRCVDQVEQCAATCKRCEPASSDSSRRVCNDWYHGFPGAKCTEAVAAGGN